MNPGQGLDRNSMLARDRQFLPTIFEQPASQAARLHPEVLAPERTLDDDLPRLAALNQRALA